MFIEVTGTHVGLPPMNTSCLCSNLIAARKLGIRTIRECRNLRSATVIWNQLNVVPAGVAHGNSSSAIRELEGVVGLPLLDTKSKL